MSDEHYIVDFIRSCVDAWDREDFQGDRILYIEREHLVDLVNSPRFHMPKDVELKMFLLFGVTVRCSEEYTCDSCSAVGDVYETTRPSRDRWRKVCSSCVSISSSF